MPSEIFLVKGDSRSKAINQLLDQFDLGIYKGKQIALKANYNSADSYPAQTHLDTLTQFIKKIQSSGAKEIIMGERSGMGNTKDILEKSGVLALGKKLKITVQILNDLPVSGWVHFDVEGSHWNRGFLLAKLFTEADFIVQTCCLKTHRFGGHFTLSLKNSVGMIARFNPQDGYDYMGELHSSLYQREMIAEINAAYEPNLILMDGVTAFTKGGPAQGEKVTSNVFLAGSDRIAMDAVGVALLRHFGTTPEVQSKSIFDQTQLARSIELGLGAKSLHDIKLVPLDDSTEHLAENILAQFAK
ncbi:MAG: DUF362 domain-containing protein [Candidatus Thorarchaeota archaeon]